MQEIKIAICDDSQVELEIIKKKCIIILAKHKIPYDIKTFKTGKLLLESENKFDLILLDVEMCEINGIDVKNKIEDNSDNTKIIFISNYQDRVLDAFGKNVFAYIKKNELNCLEYVLLKLYKNLMDVDIIEINNRNEIIKEIFYLEANSAYTIVHFDKRTEVVRKNLKDFEIALASHGFYRIHKSYIINLRYIKSISYSCVELINHKSLRISRGTHDRLKEVHMKFIKERSLW